MTPAPRTQRPKVEVNFAQTWDAKISTRALTPSDFSSSTDKHRLLQIRSSADAVLVGVRTAIADQMTIGLRDPDLRAQRTQRGQPEFPLRILVSRSGQIPLDLPVFQSEGGPILIFSTSAMPERVRAELQTRAVLHLQPGSELSMAEVLEILHAQHGIRHLVCEGGPTLLRNLLASDMVDVLNLTVCPRIFGGKTAPTLSGPAGGFLPESRLWRMERMETVAGECYLRYARTRD
jgi:riboflavin-specific deaminase-like protein